ncbi:MAG: hypothetical protein GX799_11525 [Crenarchaeota archaeon]|nr:hypothetical protein [Thermoproteota archaeon]
MYPEIEQLKQTQATQPNKKQCSDAIQNSENLIKSKIPHELVEDKAAQPSNQSSPTSNREILVRDLSSSGWQFTIKGIGGKSYFYARRGRNENKSLGVFDDEANYLVRKLNLKVTGLTD